MTFQKKFEGQILDTPPDIVELLSSFNAMAYGMLCLLDTDTAEALRMRGSSYSLRDLLLIRTTQAELDYLNLISALKSRFIV